jgi:hypothetical protein
MSNNQAIMQQRALSKPPPATDGWSDAAAEAAERTIRGQLLKFADRRWTVGKEATAIQDGTKLIALATAAMWVRWEDGKPVNIARANPAGACRSATNSTISTRACGRKAPAANHKTHGATRGWSISSIPAPPRLSPSAQPRGAAAVQ